MSPLFHLWIFGLSINAYLEVAGGILYTIRSLMILCNSESIDDSLNMLMGAGESCIWSENVDAIRLNSVI